MKHFITALAISCTGITWSQEPPAPSPPPAKESMIYITEDEPAEFPGGIAALKKFIADNLVYPETAKTKEIEGKCYLQFTVSAEGNISAINVKRGVYDCPECDQEAVRVVRAMPAWKPAKMNGKPVNSYFHLPITFKLPEPAEEPKK